MATTATKIEIRNFIDGDHGGRPWRSRVDRQTDGAEVSVV